jgi:hypothetical protein
MGVHKMVYKNKNYTKRDYETTNIVACVADSAPNENWIESDESALTGLTQLWTQSGVTFYGHM